MIARILMTLFCAAAMGQESLDGLPAPGSEVPWLDPELQPAIVRDAVKVKLSTHAIPGDIGSVRAASERLDLTLEKALEMEEVFPHKPVVDEGELISEQRAKVQSIWIEALDSIFALDEIIARYERFLSQEKLKRESIDYKLGISVTLAAWLAETRWLISWSKLIENRPALEAILNEADVDAGVPKGAYATIRERLMSQLPSGLGKLHELEPDRTAALEKAYFLPSALIKHRWLLEERRKLERLVPKVRPTLADPRWRPSPAWGEPESFDVTISTTQLHEASLVLAPGDILLRRSETGPRDWGGAGYWNGAGLYVGSGEVATVIDASLVQRKLLDWASVSSVAALRLKIAEAQRATAISRAVGAFETGIALVRAAYKDVPPSSNAIVASFDEEYARKTQLFDLIWFLDMKTGAAETARSTEEELRRSWRRPRWVMNAQKGDGRIQ